MKQVDQCPRGGPLSFFYQICICVKGEMPEVLLSQYFADVIAMTHTYEVRKILMTNYSSFIQTCIVALRTLNQH